jgi:hypothetical protein
MSLVNNFDALKSRLKDKWLDYYEANHSWITSTGLHPNNRVHPAYEFVLGVVSALEPEAAEFISLFARTNPNVDNLAMVLGLYFDPRVELRARTEVAKEVIQEAKLLSASEADDTDPLIEELGREVKQLNSNSE